MENIDNQEIMVSIKCLAYNHERYIRKALDGFLMQKTNFKFEVIVHDDASTDNTAAIIREYEEKYPDISNGRKKTIYRINLFEESEVGDIINYETKKYPYN